MKDKTKILSCIIAIVCAGLLLTECFIHFKRTGQVDANYIEEAVTVLDKVTTYNITDEEVKDLPSTEIVVQTEEDEKQVSEEQATTETEGFELQGEIAYNGDNEFPNVAVGNYKGLTYYSQIDNRWRNHPYTSVNNPSQTIGSSGCRTNFRKYDSNSYKRNNYP